MRTHEVLDLVTAERRYQAKKHGEFNTCANPSMGTALALAILIEEVGEVGTAICDAEGDPRIIEELVQVAAVAVAWVEGLLEKEDRRKTQLAGRSMTTAMSSSKSLTNV